MLQKSEEDLINLLYTEMFGTVSKERLKSILEEVKSIRAYLGLDRSKITSCK